MTTDISSKAWQHEHIPHAFRAPKRISITIPHHTFQQLAQRSAQEGRSLSNLAAFLLESANDLQPTERHGSSSSSKG